ARSSTRSATSWASCTTRTTWSRSRLLAAAREPDDRDEELVDLPDHRHEPVEVDGLGHVRVGEQLVAAQDVLLGGGRGEHHHRDGAQLRIALDLLQDLAAVVLGQVEVQQDQVGAGLVGVLAPLVEEVERLQPVADHVQVVAYLVVLERLPRDELVAGVVLDEEHFDGLADGGHEGDPSEGAVAAANRASDDGESERSVKQIRVPSPSCEVSSQIRPPWVSTIFLHIARPMPVPL